MKNFFTLIALISALTMAAREPQRGYRGFVDANVDLTFVGGGYGESCVETYYGISTSHGFQFNPHFFLGGGLMFERVHTRNSGHKMENPIYVHARTDWTFGRVPLYGDVRIGGVLFGDYRFYMSPTVGYRFNWGRKANLNVGAGMTFRGYGWSDEKTLHPQLAVRLGIDF